MSDRVHPELQIVKAHIEKHGYRRVTDSALEKILLEHKKWVEGAGGKQANLEFVDLSCEDEEVRLLHFTEQLPGSLLYEANLRKASLRGANLSGVQLNGAELCEADLTGCDLQHATLIPLCSGSFPCRLGSIRSC